MQADFEPLEILAELTVGPPTSLIFLAATMLLVWAIRNVIKVSRWQVWLGLAVLAVATAVQSYFVITQILQPPTVVLFAVTKEGIRCIDWPDRVVPLEDVQDISTTHYVRGRVWRFTIGLHLKESAPEYADAKMDHEYRVRKLYCEVHVSEEQSGKVERIPAYWRDVVARSRS